MREGRRGFDRDPPQKHKAVCSDCGSECEVPFEPTPGRAVYCTSCWQKKRRF